MANSDSSTILTSTAELVKNSLAISAIHGQLTLDNNHTLSFVGDDPSNNFQFPLSDISLADFSNLPAGRIDLSIHEGNTYKLMFADKWSPTGLIPAVGAAGAGATILRAQEWHKTLVPLLSPGAVKELKGFFKRIVLGTLLTVGIVIAVIFALLLIGTHGHIFSN